jgi:predicted nucleic acid-binding protein
VRTAIDTNVISILWSGTPKASRSRMLLDQAGREGTLVVCGIVCSELLAHPAADEAGLHRFLTRTDIVADYELHRAIWLEAGRRFGAYAKRRRTSGGGEPRRLLADFLVGAHAILEADRLLTFDRSAYLRDFPELTIMS